MPLPGPQYPVNLVVQGRRCLVIGGGRVAIQKVQGLVEAGAVVHVIATAVDPSLAALPGVTHEQRAFRPGDTEGFRLVITATDDAEVNRAVAADAEQRGVWVNSADDPANCTFTLPARVRRGPLLITVSTGGSSPAVASWLRRRLEGEIGPEYETLLELVAAERALIIAAGRGTEGLDWQSALDSGMLDLIREGRLAEAKERLQACLSSSSA